MTINFKAFIKLEDGAVFHGQDMQIIGLSADHLLDASGDSYANMSGSIVVTALALENIQSLESFISKLGPQDGLSVEKSQEFQAILQQVKLSGSNTPLEFFEKLTNIASNLGSFGPGLTTMIDAIRSAL